MLNTAAIMGRLCQDPELKTTNTGVNVTSFTVAVDRSYCKQGEERQADFINVVAWRGTADFVTNYFHKGSMIAIQGSIQTRKYEDKEGNKRNVVEIVASQVSFCGSKNEGNIASAPNAVTQGTTNSENTTDFEMLDGDDELPF